MRKILLLLRPIINARLLFIKKEAEFIEKGIASPLPSWSYSIGGKINDLYKYYFEPVGCDIAIDEKLYLNNFGIDAYVIHTPGHSIGSVSIIVNNEIAITGDAFLDGIDKKPFQKKINKASEEAINSFQILLSLKCKNYITSHIGIISYEELENRYREYIAFVTP